jgi:hypothetical protein
MFTKTMNHAEAWAFLYLRDASKFYSKARNILVRKNDMKPRFHIMRRIMKAGRTLVAEDVRMIQRPREEKSVSPFFKFSK